MARYVNSLTAAEIISEHTNISLHEVVDIMTEVPSEDVEPVRHGHWRIIETLCGGKESKYCRCSECNKANVIRSNYCGNCGARMDGDADANGNDNKTPET